MRLAAIPLEFLSTLPFCSWHFVVDLLDIITGKDPALPPIIRDATTREPINLDSTPVAGDYEYLPGGRSYNGHYVSCTSSL